MIDIKNSPHYDKIVAFQYEDNDIVSKLLIECFQAYLGHIKSKKSKYNIDKIMDEYTNKFTFYQYVQNYFNPSESLDLCDSFDKVMLKLNKLYKNYIEEQNKVIESTRWL